MNDFDDIKGQLDNYSLDDYNIDQGWNKLQKRNPNKKQLLVRMVMSVAAACLLMILGYWFLVHQTKEKKPPVARIHKDEHKQSLTQPTDTVTRGKVVVINKHKISSEKKISDALGGKRQQEPAFSQEKIIKEDAVKLPGPVLLANSNISPREPAHSPVTPKPAGQKKSLEIINEQELDAMIMIPEEPHKKNSKLLTFFAEKGEQAEYTDVKFSSMPGNTQQIIF